MPDLSTTRKRKISADCCKRILIGGKSILGLPPCKGEAERKRGAAGTERHAKEHAAGFYNPPDLEALAGPALVLIRKGNAGLSSSLTPQGSAALVMCWSSTAPSGSG